MTTLRSKIQISLRHRIGAEALRAKKFSPTRESNALDVRSASKFHHPYSLLFSLLLLNYFSSHIVIKTLFSALQSSLLSLFLSLSLSLSLSFSLSLLNNNHANFLRLFFVSV